MNDTHTSILDPLPDTATLDIDRADRFGTFLAVEAAADAASARSTAPRLRGRRVLGGVVAASVLAGGFFAVNAVVGGPGPAAVEAGAAVTIKQSAGWTTISINDPKATPAEIEAELEAVGIDARIVDQGPGGPATFKGAGTPPAHGTVSFYGLPVTTETPDTDPRHAFYAVASFGGQEAGDLTGLAVDFTLPDDFALSGFDDTVTTAPVDPAGPPVTASSESFEAALAELGVNVGPNLADGTVSIKDGSDVEIVLYAS